MRHAFSGVRNTAPPVIPDYGGHLAFGEGEVGRKVTVIPLKEARKLALSWPLPPRRRYRKTKPTIYISHLLVSRYSLVMIADDADAGMQESLRSEQ